MNFINTLRSIAVGFALFAVAGTANAKTVTFADVSATGAFTYNEASTETVGFCPFCLEIEIPANGSLSGGLSANLYGNTSVVRDYILTYSLSATWNNVTDSVSGSIDIPLAFSIDNVLASIGAPIGSTSSGVVLTPVGLLTYSGLDVTATSIDGDVFLLLGGSIFEDIAGTLGLSGNQSGSLSANFALVSTVPLPATAPMLIFAVGGIVALRRKRRKVA